MAAIDKIYGTRDNFIEFRDWCKENYPSALQYFYYPDDNTWDTEWNDGKEHPITNFPKKIDKWMWNNCPIEWVKEEIKFQYDTSIQVLED